MDAASDQFDKAVDTAKGAAGQVSDEAGKSGGHMGWVIGESDMYNHILANTDDDTDTSLICTSIRSPRPHHTRSLLPLPHLRQPRYLEG